LSYHLVGHIDIHYVDGDVDMLD